MSKLAILAPARLEVTELDPDLRKEFLAKDAEVNDAMVQFGKAGLRLGKKLSEMQELLTGERRFVVWLKSKMPAKTGYRLIGAWDRLKTFSPIIAEKAVAADIPMFGVTERAPFGKYTKVIKLMPPPPKDDPAKADEWLALLRSKYQATPVKKHSALEYIAELVARSFLRDRKADDFDDWLKKVEKRAQEIIDSRQKE